jgi:PAS domain S-box-containing protein
MTTQRATSGGLALLCDTTGEITEILHDGLSPPHSMAPGTAFISNVEQADVPTALSFLAELRANGRSFGRQLRTAGSQHIMPLTVAGARAGDYWLIVMTSARASLRPLCQQLSLNRNTTIAAACQQLVACTDEIGAPSLSEMELFDEISRLNNELINMRRQLESRVARQTTEIKATDRRFRAIFEQTGLGIALADLRGKVIDVNPALERLLSLNSKPWQDRPLLELLNLPDSTGTLAELDRELHQGLRQDYRTRQRRLQGDGSETWLLVSGTVVRDERGQPAFILYIVDDITGRKQTETALLHAEKLTVAGRLAASLAHEINNPLQSVIGFIGLAQEAKGEGKNIERYLHMAMQELRRVSQIVHRLRDLHLPSRLEEPQPADLGAILQRVMALSSQQCAKQHVECTSELEPGLPPVVVVPDRVQQVFLNLVLNALDAMPDGGRLHTTARRTDSPLGVEVSFEDTGMGMPAQVLDRVFDPFYSTKPDGLGLGLYISRDIVEQLGGRITADSRPGEGSRFVVWLPA